MEPVGYALAHLRGPEETWETGERIGVLETLTVLPDERGRGIGSALFERIYAELRRLGVTELQVAVISKNAEALRFYERHGPALPCEMVDGLAFKVARVRALAGARQDDQQDDQRDPHARGGDAQPAARPGARSPGLARSREMRPSGGTPVQSSSSQAVIDAPGYAFRHWGTVFGSAPLWQNQNTRDTKLIQYLNEAYGKEKELETSLQAHIGLTTRPPYKKRLQQHRRRPRALAWWSGASSSLAARPVRAGTGADRP